MDPFPPPLVVLNKLAIPLINSFTLPDALMVAKSYLSGTPCV